MHTAQLMPLPLTVSCFTKIQIGVTFLVPAHLGSPGKGQLNGCVCVCVPETVQVTIKVQNLAGWCQEHNGMLKMLKLDNKLNQLSVFLEGGLFSISNCRCVVVIVISVCIQ